MYVYIYKYGWRIRKLSSPPLPFCTAGCRWVLTLYIYVGLTRVLTKSSVVLSIGNSKSNHLGAQGTLNLRQVWNS